ncbi:uncharacterized protein LOC124899570 [Capsicum annuum]|uniref:uncharacterized protein LOC124899570 n=1 Tax=Capsicum annuum TaxID=4072 RepID=UPI001FB0CF51|nr:uncharacterized protein LOC124899570 [Capsicum annuum]
MNGYVLAKKILRAGYYWLTMEQDCFCFVHKCHQCQIHGDLIHSPPSELYPMSAPWPFIAWGIDVIGPIEPKASNGHRFILSIITDNATNLNSHLMKKVCERFKIVHHHSTPYRPKANEVVEEANKNIKKKLKFPHFIVEVEIDDTEWVKSRQEQLSLIDEKRLTIVCFGQLYQQRMARAYNKKVFLQSTCVFKNEIPSSVRIKKNDQFEDS